MGLDQPILAEYQVHVYGYHVQNMHHIYYRTKELNKQGCRCLKIKFSPFMCKNFVEISSLFVGSRWKTGCPLILTDSFVEASTALTVTNFFVTHFIFFMTVTFGLRLSISIRPDTFVVTITLPWWSFTRTNEMKYLLWSTCKKTQKFIEFINS